MAGSEEALKPSATQYGPGQYKPRHDRLYYVIQNRVRKRFYIPRLEVRGTKYRRLEKLTPIALEIDR
jgi:hypothetical protein